MMSHQQHSANVIYEQFGAPALIYRNAPAWNAQQQQQQQQPEEHDQYGNCLSIIKKSSGNYMVVRTWGSHGEQICVSELIMSQSHERRREAATNSATNTFHLHDPIQQIVSCCGLTDDCTYLMVRTSHHRCSVIRAMESSSCSSSISLEEVTSLNFNDYPSTHQEIPTFCTAYSQCATSSCFFGSPPMFAIAGSKNTIHQVILDGNPIISNRFETICNQKLIEYSFHPMILWSSAYSSASGTDFGNMLFQLDLRSNDATRVWSPSHANKMVEGMCSIRSFLPSQHDEYTAFATSSLGKLYELDTRMPMKHVVEWTLSAEVDAYRQGDDILAIDENSTNTTSTNILAIQKAPLAYGLRLYQSPLQCSPFETVPLECGPYCGISATSSIATTTVYAFSEVSPKVFHCGLASLRIPLDCLLLQTHNDDDWDRPRSTALCVFLLTSMGDIYCHTLLECDREEPRQAYAYEGLPIGMSAIPVPQGDINEIPSNDDSHYLSLHLTNKYPISSTAILPSFVNHQFKMVPIPTNVNYTNLQEDAIEDTSQNTSTKATSTATATIKELLSAQPRAHWEIQRHATSTGKEDIQDLIRDACESKEESFCFGTSNKNGVMLKSTAGGIVPIAKTSKAATSYIIPSTVASVSFLGLEAITQNFTLPELNSKRSDVTKEKIMKLDKMWDEL